MSIQNREAHRLAPAIMQETGAKQSKRRQLRAIAGQITARVTGSYVDHAELLYDEHGLPK